MPTFIHTVIDQEGTTAYVEGQVVWFIVAQDHEVAAQIAAQRLQLPEPKVSLVNGDSVRWEA